MTEEERKHYFREGVLHEFLRRRNAEKLVKNLKDEEREFLAEAALEFTALPEMIHLCRQDPTFKENFELVKSSLTEKKVKEELFGVFEKRKDEA